jgi:hypothetical protein
MFENVIIQMCEQEGKMERRKERKKGKKKERRN